MQNRFRSVTLAALLAFSIPPVSAQQPDSPAKPVHLRCESLENPLGIDALQPQFSWQMQDTRRNAKQTAYELMVSASASGAEGGRRDIWDSGKQTSSDSQHISYGGPQLKSGERYSWSVRIWDAQGAASAVSAASWWEMGLLNKSDWKSQWIQRNDPEQVADRHAGVKWIWVPGENANVKVAPGKRYFRYHWQLQKAPKAATLLVAGKDSMEAFVNGDKVGASDTWGTFDVIDIHDKLKAGTNSINVTVTTAGTGGMAALLKLTAPDGAIERIPSDTRWEASSNSDSGFVPAAISADLGAKPVADPWPPQPASYFRKAFSATNSIAKARLYVTALGAYRAFLNGKRISEDTLTPGWTDYSKHIQYQTYDVTSLVKKGGNVLAAVVGDGWYASGLGWKLQRYLFGPPPLRLNAQLEIAYADGTHQTVATDSTWQASTGAILNDEIYAGETYDARKAVMLASASKEGSWKPAMVGDAPEGALLAQRDAPMRASQTLTPKAVTNPAAGVYVFDLGQNISGWARLRVKGPRGTEVRLRFAEILKPDGNIYRENLRSAKATDTYILKGSGEETYEPFFTYHGFRYIEVTGYPGKPSTSDITGIAFHTVMPETGKFETSSALVNQLWSNILWGQRDNLVSIPTDCPQRDERLGWMADAQIFWRTASYNMDIDAFAHKWLIDVRDARSPEGAFSDVSPRVVDTADGAPGWGDAGIIVPWITWQQYGDLRVVSQNWDAMTGWLKYLHDANPNFLWENRRNNDFGDWVPANSTTPKDLMATAFWAYDAKLMTQMATALGKTSEAAQYQQLYQSIKAAFIAKFVKEDGSVGNGSQTSDVLALHMDLLPDQLRKTVADRLEQDINSRGGHLSTGFAGTAFLMPVLSDNGKNDIAYHLLLNDTYPSWGYMIRKGATTMWERWNGDTGDPSMNSYNHYAFGAVGQWLYQNVAGIMADPAAPGFQKIIIRPRPGKGLTHASAEYESPYGTIATAWTADSGKPFDLTVTIPANTTATVYLPPYGGNHATQEGAALSGDTVTVGSGTHHYQVQ